MKKICFIFLMGLISIQLHAQNSIGFEAGYLRTHTSVAEYLRYGSNYNLLDVVLLNPDVGSFQAAITTDIDMGKRFFLSTGFHYARKGIGEVSISDSSTTYYVNPTQRYVGLSIMIKYHYRFKKSNFGILLETGPLVDFAVGKPNNGALYSGTYYKYFMPFSRFNEVDLSWAADIGGTFKLGTGDVVLKLSYRYGLSDVIEDAFIIGRSSSFGISAGYAFRLGK